MTGDSAIKSFSFSWPFIAAIEYDDKRQQARPYLSLWEGMDTMQTENFSFLNEVSSLYHKELPLGGYEGLVSQCYQMDEKTVAVVLVLFTTNQLMVHHLFVMRDPLSRVEMVHDRSSSIMKERIHGVKLFLSSECCRLAVWFKTIIEIWDDELNALQVMNLHDYIPRDTPIDIADVTIEVRLAQTFVIVVLHQGVLLIFTLADNHVMLIGREDVSVENVGEVIQRIEYFPDFNLLYLLYSSQIRQYRLRWEGFDGGRSLYSSCHEEAWLPLNRAIKHTTHGGGSSSSTSSTTSLIPFSVVVAAHPQRLDCIQKTCILTSVGIVVCDEVREPLPPKGHLRYDALRPRRYIPWKLLGFDMSIISAKALFHDDGHGMNLILQLNEQTSLCFGQLAEHELAFDEITDTNGPHQYIQQHRLAEKDMTSSIHRRQMEEDIQEVAQDNMTNTNTRVSYREEEEEILGEEIDFFRPVDNMREGSLLAIERGESLSVKPGVGSVKRTSSSSALKPDSSNSARIRSRGDWEAPRRNSLGQIVDQPVTFHKNIKSSGYGQNSNKQPPRRYNGVAPKVARGNGVRSTSAPRMASAQSKLPVGGHKIRMYPMDCEMMNLYQAHLDYPERMSGKTNGAMPVNSPIYHMNFCADGSRLALACHNHTIVSLKMPKNNQRNQYESITFSGHDNAVTSVQFSHLRNVNEKYSLLSASRDQTARIWSESKTDTSLVTFSHLYKQADAVYNTFDRSISSNGNSTVTKYTSKPPPSISLGGGTSKSRNKPYGEEIKHAIYFYHDRFVLLAVKSTVLMYKYNVDPTSNEHNTNDLTRFLHTGSYKLHHKWDFQSSKRYFPLLQIKQTQLIIQYILCTDGESHNVCALAALNTVQSPLILVSTSDK
eukprot:scaffold2923_cov199-Ochromonas_danica.AAC.6